MTRASSGDEAAAQLGMVHRLPRVPLVERIPWVLERCAGRTVTHVGFADTGFREMNERAGAWLHAQIASVATELVGVDIDEAGVDVARAEGYVAHVADCTDPVAVRALGLAPADVVVAGELIEHLERPGDFLDAMASLVAPGGTLVLTTPNASGGFLNSAAALGRREVNHPDHVILFSWRTLTLLMERHGWEVVEAATYVPQVKSFTGRSAGERLVAAGGRVVVGLERAAARLGASFFADGLAVAARRR